MEASFKCITYTADVLLDGELYRVSVEDRRDLNSVTEKVWALSGYELILSNTNQYHYRFGAPSLTAYLGIIHRALLERKKKQQNAPDRSGAFL